MSRLTALIAHYHGIKTRAEIAGCTALFNAAQAALDALMKRNPQK